MLKDPTAPKEIPTYLRSILTRCKVENFIGGCGICQHKHAFFPAAFGGQIKARPNLQPALFDPVAQDQSRRTQLSRCPAAPGEPAGRGAATRARTATAGASRFHGLGADLIDSRHSENMKTSTSQQTSCCT